MTFVLCSGIHARAAASKPAREQEWEKTLAAAKKEGRFNFYVGRYGTEAFLNEFRKEYPEIKVVTVNGTGNDLATRILSEVRARKILADLFSGGANTNYNLLYKGKTLDSIKDALILPEVVDESKWYEGQHTYGDPEGKHIFIYIANPTSSSLYFNTTLASPGEFKSHWDLLNPKWQGKFVSQPPLSTGLGATMIFFYYNPELGPEFIRRLFGTMDITYGKDRRQITDWLVQGKFAICLGCRDAPRAKTQGLPVDEFDTGGWKEGESLSTGGGSMSLIKGAPHPNASRVFINWFLSRKGQIALQRHKDLYGELPPNSRRLDIPKDDLPPESRLIKGRKYLDTSRAEWQDMAPIFKLVKEVMAGREKK
ncbi:MAG TPA: extracellular solute-binding protein [Candidatus Binatia bacterium]|nr:extracellular solute-binding protein [Candidatus Binatia bacterium]